MSQITLRNTIDQLISFGTGHTQINTVNFGSADNMASATVAYPLLRINYLSTELNDKRVIYNFQIVCADKKINTTDTELYGDNSLITKYSLTEGYLQQLAGYVKDSSNFRNLWKVENPIKIFAAADQFLDGACANVLNLSLSVANLMCLSDIQLTGGAS